MLSLILLVCIVDFCIGTCSNGWDEFNGSCYKLVNDEESWPEAYYICKSAWAASLLSITSAEEQDFILNLINGTSKLITSSIWMGANDLLTEGSWVWEQLDGSMPTLSYDNWHQGQPNNEHGNANCAVIDKHSFEWSDRPCSSHYVYICEKPSENI